MNPKQSMPHCHSPPTSSCSAGVVSYVLGISKQTVFRAREAIFSLSRHWLLKIRVMLFPCGMKPYPWHVPHFSVLISWTRQRPYITISHTNKAPWLSKRHATVRTIISSWVRHTVQILLIWFQLNTQKFLHSRGAYKEQTPLFKF